LVVDQGRLLQKGHAPSVQSATKMSPQTAEPRGARLEVAEVARLQRRCAMSRGAQHALERVQERGGGLDVTHQSFDIHVDSSWDGKNEKAHTATIRGRASDGKHR